MKMNLASLSDKAGWEKAGVTLPAYDVEKMAAATKENPISAMTKTLMSVTAYWIVPIMTVRI
jgi:hypothetical protein